MKRSLIICLIGLASLAGCKNEHPAAFDPSAAKKDIEAINSKFSELFVKGDSAGVAALYTKDAEFMDTGSPAVVGRSAIQSTMAGFMKAGITKVDFKTTGIFGCDSLLAEEGQLNLFVKDQKVADDKYIVLWKKEDGQWKIFRDISNSNMPQKAAK